MSETGTSTNSIPIYTAYAKPAHVELQVMFHSGVSMVTVRQMIEERTRGWQPENGVYCLDFRPSPSP